MGSSSGVFVRSVVSSPLVGLALLGLAWLGGCQAPPAERRGGDREAGATADRTESIQLATVPLRWSASGSKTSRAAVLIAADSYAGNSAWALPSAATSVDVVRDMLVDRCGFARESITVLRGQDVSADRVEAAIAQAGEQLRGASDGLLWVYLCGHGWVVEGEQHVFTYLTREDEGRYHKTLGRGDLVRWMAAVRSKAARCEGVLVVDACRRNVGDPPPRAKLVRSDVWELYGVKDGQLVAAGNGGEAFAFTKALADAVAALAPGGDADLRRVVTEAAPRTRSATSVQEPELREPADAGTAPSLVLRNRVRFTARAVDALSGVLLPGASVGFDDQKHNAPTGEVGLAGSPSEHVLALAAPGYLPRTERLVLKPEQTGASVDVPLYPAVTLVRGQVDPPSVVKLRALVDGARVGYHVLETTSDARGAFELRLPKLAGARVDVLQDGKVLVPVELPAVAQSLLSSGDSDGVGLVEVRVALPTGTVARPANAPTFANDADRIDWDRAQRMVDAGRYDLAREAAASLRQVDGLTAWRQWLDSRWAEKELVDGLRAGKERGDWAQVDEVVRWWKLGGREVDNRERIAALVEEIRHEHMPLEARRAYEQANLAFAEGQADAALQGYLAVRDRLTPYYQALVKPQVERLRLQLYEQHMNAAAQAELDGDAAAALDAYARALPHNDRARTPATRLLARHPRLADSAAAKQIGVVAPTAAADAAAARARITATIGLIMVPIGAQEFVRGTPGGSGDEKPVRVKITKPYWIGETEVTQAQWREVMGTTPWKGQRTTTEGDDVAATHVSWSDALEFCRKLTERERASGRLPDGYRYILPTQAEWELACRAGSSAAYCFGDDAGLLGQFAVFDGARRGAYAHAVKQRKPSAWGLYDMHGNVTEWCLDTWDRSREDRSDELVDPYISGGPWRLRLGGGWDDSAQRCRSASRMPERDRVDGNRGFRAALAARPDVK